MISIASQLQRAQRAKQSVQLLPHATRQRFLKLLAQGLRRQTKHILRGNAKDVAAFDTSDPMRDRLLLTPARIDGMAKEVEGLLAIPDPIGQLYDQRTRHGLQLCRKRVPLGVIGVVYESRPNVTTDVTAICIKSGNVVILKGGREAQHSYAVLLRVIQTALRQAGIDPYAVQMLEPTKRELVQQLITANGLVDVVIPRGSQRLIEAVRSAATVPVIETGAGVCHTFVDATAKLPAAARVVFNAKTQRPSVCNALDTALVHQKIARPFLHLLAPLLAQKNVEIFADATSWRILRPWYPAALLQHTRPADFGREFLSQKMSIKVVRDVHEAIAHIQKYSSKHSEAILTNTAAHKQLFINLVDAAVVYVNSSTRFSDGAMFGLGSEIGNSTQKLHARGPMGPAEMTTYKWIVVGNYTPRPDA